MLFSRLLTKSFQICGIFPFVLEKRSLKLCIYLQVISLSINLIFFGFLVRDAIEMISRSRNATSGIALFGERLYFANNATAVVSMLILLARSRGFLRVQRRLSSLLPSSWAPPAVRWRYWAGFVVVVVSQILTGLPPDSTSSNPDELSTSLLYAFENIREFAYISLIDETFHIFGDIINECKAQLKISSQNEFDKNLTQMEGVILEVSGLDPGIANIYKNELGYLIIHFVKL